MTSKNAEASADRSARVTALATVAMMVPNIPLAVAAAGES